MTQLNEQINSQTNTLLAKRSKLRMSQKQQRTITLTHLTISHDLNVWILFQLITKENILSHKIYAL